MTDREPVNIMGVVAFPNPNKDERVIRFIDSEYHTLFTIKDGESIVINRFDGEKMVLPCKYIDDCHVCVGNSAYHICEFAEMQERSGNTYVPSAPKISGEICTYEIYQIPATADVDYYFRSYSISSTPNSPTATIPSSMCGRKRMCCPSSTTSSRTLRPATPPATTPSGKRLRLRWTPRSCSTSSTKRHRMSRTLRP